MPRLRNRQTNSSSLLAASSVDVRDLQSDNVGYHDSSWLLCRSFGLFGVSTPISTFDFKIKSFSFEPILKTIVIKLQN